MSPASVTPPSAQAGPGLAAPVHFIGLGGAGMSAVARVLLGRGLTVSGSDAADSRTLRAVEKLGASVQVGHRSENLAGAATVVVSTAIRPENPELAAARARGLPVLHRSEALAAAMTGRDVIAIAGTHGKTTTTAMTTLMLQQAGRRPSFAIGGDVAALGTNAAWDAGDAFVAEADESDGSFLNYRPRLAVVTNIEPDHLDHYGSAEAVYEAFDRFAALLPADGLLVACADDAGAAALAARAAHRTRVRTYGYAASADFRLSATRALGSASNSRISFSLDGLESDQELQLSVPGRHNILNAAAAFAAGLELGLDPAQAAAGLAAFSGASRRFEARGGGGGIRVFDDYAHHPTEVTAALQAARTVAAGHRVHVLFQPHLFSRTREFAGGFAAALGLADSARVLDIYAAREDPVPGVTSRLITDGLQVPGGYVPQPARALAAMVDAARPGDILLTIGAGDVTRYGEELVRLLAERYGTEGAPS
jgi:UDP-N-acetylmuramate--alanine ligase